MGTNFKSIAILSLYFFGAIQIGKAVASMFGLEMMFGYAFGILGGVLLIAVIFGFGAFLTRLENRKRERTMRELTELQEILNNMSERQNQINTMPTPVSETKNNQEKNVVKCETKAERLLDLT